MSYHGLDLDGVCDISRDDTAVIWPVAGKDAFGNRVFEPTLRLQHSVGEPYTRNPAPKTRTQKS